MPPQSFFKVGESTWVKHWTNRLEQPVLAEVRFDFKSISGINIDEDCFDARFLVYVRIKASDLYRSWDERQLEPGGAFVEIGNQKVEEFTPWLEFYCQEKKKNFWVHGKESEGLLTYAYDLEATLSLETRKSGFWYPFDYHTLLVPLSSNWDSKRLIFIPWDSKWTLEMALATLDKSVAVVDDKCARIRSVPGKTTHVSNLWFYVSIPRVIISSTDGFRGHSQYSEARASVYVQRRVKYHFIYEMFRPLILGLLSPCSLFFLDDPNGRLSFNVSIIVGMTMGFMNSKNKRITMADYYKLALFAYAAICLVLALLPNGKSLEIQLLACGLFVLLHLLFVLRVISTQPQRLSVYHTHRIIKKNGLDSVFKRLADQAGVIAGQAGTMVINVPRSAANSSIRAASAMTHLGKAKKPAGQTRRPSSTRSSQVGGEHEDTANET